MLARRSLLSSPTTGSATLQLTSISGNHLDESLCSQVTRVGCTICAMIKDLIKIRWIRVWWLQCFGSTKPDVALTRVLPGEQTDVCGSLGSVNRYLIKQRSQKSARYFCHVVRCWGRNRFVVLTESEKPAILFSDRTSLLSKGQQGQKIGGM